MAKIELPVLPAHLYRYRSFRRENSLSQEIAAINSAYLYCSPFLSMNDPMECVYSPSMASGRGSYYKRAIERLYRQKGSFLFACFSETPNNELMWAHYAANYSGICIEYDAPKLVRCLDSGVSVVRLAYGDTPPAVDMDKPLNVTQTAKEILSHKKSSWAYEREWRVLGRTSPMQYQRKKCVTSVYFGSRIEPENREAIMKELKGGGFEFFDMEVEGYDHSFTRTKPKR